MALQLAELHKLYASNKYNPTVFFLNPFTEILFLNNWVWPEEYIAQKKHTIKKINSSGDGLKQKIKQWFLGLNFQAQKTCLMIRDKKFIEVLCYFLPSYKSGNLYNMKNKKCIKSVEVQESNSFTDTGVNIILQNFQVAFLKEPILHLSKNCQKFVSNELIKWMEIISQQKLFQFANKYKQSELLQDNILWFSENSFHKLQCFIVNEFQKAILKGYFNRDRIQSNYFQDILKFCQSQKQIFKNKNVQFDLLQISIKNVSQLAIKQIESKFNQMKNIQEKYEKEKEKLFQKLLEDDILIETKDQGKKKKRRLRKKAKSNQQEQSPTDKVESPKQNSKNNSKCHSPKKSQKQKIFEVDELIKVSKQQEKKELNFNDQISQISKCSDSQFHETDVTFEKYFDNEQKLTIQQPQNNSRSKSFQILPEQKIMKKYTEESIKITEQVQVKEEILEDFSKKNNESNQQSTKENISKQKRKSKKEKIINSLQQNLLKSVRNNSFTEFIDTISIESNNLYNFKLSAYQFIVFFISSLLPTTNITLFGSNAVGLSLASSDIDIMISNNRWSSISQIREVLYHIGNQISKMGWVIDYRLILNAKVPVLKLFIDPKIDYFGYSPLKYASQTNLKQSIVIKADIIVNVEGQQNIGCQSTLLMKEWLTDHPQLQRIILFFKYVLWYYGLNQNYRGGICSYCLFIMVVSCLFKKFDALQSGQKTISQVLQDQDQGTYILQILKYYSQVFDPKIDEISITKELKVNSTIQIKEKKDQINLIKRNLTLKVVDPINGQYIESSFSKFQQIQQLFSMILVQSMKLDNEAKKFMSNNEQINQQLTKHYQYITQNNNINVITKNMEQNMELKSKKLIKKLSSKMRKFQTLKYSVKDIVGIGYKIGIENWMSSNNMNDQKINIF